MKIIRSEYKMCFDCMKEHKVQIVQVDEKTIFKNVNVIFEAEYDYCENTDDFIESEEQIKKNDLAMKDAYRKQQGLLTSSQIVSIREKYNMSQKRFSETLGWGTATIIRYENHQVQDRAHDDILRKIGSDPKWFLEMLNRAKEDIGIKHYIKSYQKATDEIIKVENPYVYCETHSSYELITSKFDTHDFGVYQQEQYPNRVVMDDRELDVSDLPLLIAAA